MANLLLETRGATTLMRKALRTGPAGDDTVAATTRCVESCSQAGAPNTSDSRLSAALEILERLVAFDTTSSRSNLELIDWIAGYLGGELVFRHGVAVNAPASAQPKNEATSRVRAA